jgi:hypothetical protein
LWIITQTNDCSLLLGAHHDKQQIYLFKSPWLIVRKLINAIVERTTFMYSAQSPFAAQHVLTFPPFLQLKLRRCFKLYSKVCTTNRGLARVLYKCLVPIYVLPEMKLCKCAASLFPKQNYNVLFPNSYTHISVRDVYLQDRSVDRSWDECGN